MSRNQSRVSLLFTVSPDSLLDSILDSFFYRLQNSRFFLKISEEIGKAWRKSLTRAKRASLTRPSHSPFSASFQTFRLTARAYLNTQKYGLFAVYFFSILYFLDM